MCGVSRLSQSRMLSEQNNRSWIQSLLSSGAADHQARADRAAAAQVSNSRAMKPQQQKLQQQPQQPQHHVIDWQVRGSKEVIKVQSVNIQHYTSLRDIMPAAMLLQLKQQSGSNNDPCCNNSSSSSSSSSNSGGDTSPRTRMKNRLVEQAARAYLQPASAAATLETHQFFPWNWQKLMGSTRLTFTFTFTFGNLFFVPPLPRPSRGFFSRALRYLLGRARPQQAAFLQHPRICV